MLVERDERTGAVRLDDEAVAAVLEGARPGAAIHPDVAAALGPGFLDGALDAIGRPVVDLEVVVAGVDSRLTHRVSVQPRTATLLLGVRPGLHQLMVVPPAYLASALVRLTRMRPRRVDERHDVPFPMATVADLVGADGARRTAALTDAGAELAWRLSVTWSGGVQEVTAVDGPLGVHLADTDAGVLRAVTNTTVYRILTTALPPEALLPAAG